MENRKYKVESINFPSVDGIHMLEGKLYIPEGEARGIFQVVHGMVEHIGRYDSFMREIAGQGFICFGFDHLGHGRSVNSDSEYGFFAHKDGWKLLCCDVFATGSMIKEKYKDLPYVLMGHSMGSFIVRNTVTMFPDFADRLIIMGTGGPNPAAGAGLALIKRAKKLRGERYTSPLIEKLMFGSYNKKFTENDTHSWLSTIEKERESFHSDPLCGFKFTVSAMGDLVTLLMECNKPDWFKSVRSDMPILLVSGVDDPVGNYGRGVKEVYDKLIAAGKNAKLKLYPNCRHEILNDTCRERVIGEIERFIDF